MQRIDAPDRLFRDGDPFNAIQGTVVTAEFLNSIQEELSSVIERAGLTLDPAHNDQLYTALQTMFASSSNVTQPIGDTSSKTATDAFVASALGGIAFVNVAGNSNVVLPQPQWGCAILILLGALTGPINVIVPAAGDQWKVSNQASGPFNITVKTPTGGGVVVPQGMNYDLWCDGTSVKSTNGVVASPKALIYFLSQS